MREGDQIGELIVTASKEKNFLEKKLLAVTLKHLANGDIEKYMQNTGLYYYKKGELEYKLVSARVKKYSEGCGDLS